MGTIKDKNGVDLTEAEEQTNELEDNTVEINFEEQNKVKRMERTEDSLSETSAASSAKSLQSCPTLCDPIDGSPPGSSVPGILHARTLE